MYDLSIIIPHYNSVDSLEVLLKSIPEKDNIQTIVVDDKSDKQLTEYESLKEQYKHIKFLRNNTDQKGAGAARNIGLNYVKGKWLLFADSDDYFKRDFYSIIEKYLDSDYDIVYFKPTSIEYGSNREATRHIRYEHYINNYNESQGRKSELELRYRFFVPWSKMINYKLIKNNNIKFEEVIASNDVMFSTKVGYYMQKFKVDNNIIYCVTTGYGTLTTSMNKDIYYSRLNEFIKYYSFLRNNLSNNDFKLLRLHGLGILFSGYKNKLMFRELLGVYKLLRKSRIKMIDRRIFNPYILYKTLKSYISIKRFYK